jgi:putative endonuclease
MNAGSYGLYILAICKNGTLYVGVTNNLRERLEQHQNGQGSEFVRKHLVHHLVEVEDFASPRDAIAREKQMKNWRRAWKIQLIEKRTPTGTTYPVYLDVLAMGPAFAGTPNLITASRLA